jgi:Flp pilus assembly protein TadG
MKKAFRALIRRLVSHRSGNAAMIVALGLPAMIGGTGLAVDTAQWYLWKRELQLAVDQAALAGAWARTQASTEETYASRATQEFNANLGVVSDFASAPIITLTDYAGGTDNSVTVAATAARTLPFTGMFLSDPVIVKAYAQASYAEGATFTSCLVALDEDTSGAITVSGTALLTARCGIAALSTSDQSIVINGMPTIDAGWVLSRGGIDEWFSLYTNDQIHEYLEGLFDPFGELEAPNPPESQVARNYYCIDGATTTRADRKRNTTVTYSYWRGADYNTAQPTSYNRAKEPTSSETNETYVIVSNDVVAGVTYTTTTTWTAVNGSAQNTIWEKRETVLATTHSNIAQTKDADFASPLPGTYTNIKIGCSTSFGKGVYIINGGELEITGQHAVVGNGVMFVLKNGASLKITGGSSINLTAMEASDLIARGLPADQANKLAGMLVFEDRASEGSNKNTINGNSATVLNGTIYLPKSGLKFAGTAKVTSQCLMIASLTIEITGTTDMTSFCPANMSHDDVVANEITKVKLVV